MRKRAGAQPPSFALSPEFIVIKKRLVARLAVYVLGLLVLAFGVAFAINSNLGISPVNALPFAVHLASGASMGLCTTAFLLLCIIFQIVLLRREFNWINLTQIIFSFIFGYFIEFAIFIVGDFTLAAYAGYFGQLIMLLISIALIACGLALYLEARLVSLPPEGVVLAITRKIIGGKFHVVKVITDSAFVVLALVVMLIFLGAIQGVREGTVLSALLIGRAIPPAKNAISFILRKAGFYGV